MKIQYNKDLTELKNAYMDAVKGLANYKVKLLFSEPVSLHYSKFMRDDKSLQEHVVNRLFFTGKNGYGNCQYEPKEEAVNVYYVSGRGKSRGFEFNGATLLLKEVEIVPSGAKDYAGQWQAIANSMRKHNINLDVAKTIEKHLRGEAEHIEGFQNYWKKSDKPKTMSFADVLERFGRHAIETGKSYSMREYNKLKLDQINASAIESMKNLATKNASGYLYYHLSKNGQKRDRSVSIQIEADGKVRYYSASEFAGCGNGDYYTMYSPTMAFYGESD